MASTDIRLTTRVEQLERDAAALLSALTAAYARLAAVENALATAAQTQALMRAELDLLSGRLSVLEEAPVVIPPIEPEPTPDPDPLPEPPAPAGIWISREEIMRLPASGAGWDQVLKEANSAWGTANLGDNNSVHDVKTLAGALAAVRLDDDALRQKTIAGLRSAMVSPLTRTLELGRGLKAYAVAADIIGYREPDFLVWVERMVFTKLPGHSGFFTIYDGAKMQWNNWSMHQRSSVLAAGLFLKRGDWIKMVTDAHKQCIGVPIEQPYAFNYASTEWKTHNMGVNPKGAVIKGISVSGVLHQDWLRGSIAFQWPPVKTGYMWEGMQGFVDTAVMLHRHKLLDISAGDQAVRRAFEMLYGLGEAAQNSPVFVFPAEGDDLYLTYIANKFCGLKLATGIGAAGKGLGWTAWLWS